MLLIAARFVQGVGGAMTSAVILGMIVTMFPEAREQPKAIGVRNCLGDASVDDRTYVLLVAASQAVGLDAAAARTRQAWFAADVTAIAAWADPASTAGLTERLLVLSAQIP